MRRTVRLLMKESLLPELDIGILDALQLDNNIQHPWSVLVTEDSREDMVGVVRTEPDSPIVATIYCDDKSMGCPSNECLHLGPSLCPVFLHNDTMPP